MGAGLRAGEMGRMDMVVGFVTLDISCCVGMETVVMCGLRLALVSFLAC